MTALARPFDEALTFVLGHEIAPGGVTFSDDPRDRGGATNYGVTQATYNAWRSAKRLPAQSVKQITHDEVRAIYLGYWNDAACPALDAIDFDRLAVVVFDCAINCGSGIARRLVQRAVGALEDGIVGKGTVAQLRTLGESQAIANFCAARLAYYDRIVARDASQRVFLASWRSRVAHCARWSGVALA